MTVTILDQENLRYPVVCQCSECSTVCQASDITDFSTVTDAWGQVKGVYVKCPNPGCDGQAVPVDFSVTDKLVEILSSLPLDD